MNEQMCEVFQRRNFVILDTETTGLGRPCEIIDIAVIDCDGNTLIDTLLENVGAFPAITVSLTGITADMCKGNVKWPILRRNLLATIYQKDVITYNAKFDRHMMHCSDEMHQLPQFDYKADSNWYCAMEAYAPYHGQWDDYHGNYRYAKLTVALEEQGVPIRAAHRALADAQMTYDLLAKMCGSNHRIPD